MMPRRPDRAERVGERSGQDLVARGERGADGELGRAERPGADRRVSVEPSMARGAGPAHELDMRPALREQWLLAVPAFVHCREDCKGLCPTCGTDLNVGACDCAPTTDSRWESLRNVRGHST